MRKLFWVSLLAAAGMFYGCGYGDGKDVDNTVIDDNNDDGPLPYLPTSCTTNLVCKDGMNVIGDCVAGVCRRFCEQTSDCEKDTICEGGLCMPVVDCPAVTLESDNKTKEYANQKCVKIFNITPSVSWSNLLKSDLVFSKENKSLFGKETDFTSNDFTFELPHSVITRGVNFSMVTYLAVNYLKLMIAAATATAQCSKPMIKNNAGDYVAINEYDKTYNYSYNASYKYNISNDPITPATMISICDKATYKIDTDMSNYYDYMISENGPCNNADDPLKCVYLAYNEMLHNKPTCESAKLALSMVKEFSNVLMQMGMTSANSSTSYEGSDAIYQWLMTSGSTDATERIFKSDFNKKDPTKGASELDLECNNGEECILATYTLTYCDAELWKANVSKNDTLYRTMTGTNEEKMKKYMNSPERIRFCNEIDVVNNEGDGNITTNFGGKTYKFSVELAKTLNEDMLTNNPMRSQLGTCVYMMEGTYDFSLMRAMSRSEDIRLQDCGMHNKLQEATVNTKELPTTYSELFGMLDNLELALAKVNQTTIPQMASLMSMEALYNNATDPSYIWLSGDSRFPLVINNSGGPFKIHDLLLDVSYKAPEAIFEVGEIDSRLPLTQTVDYTSYHDRDITVHSDDDINNDPTLEKYELNSNPHNYISTFSYTSANANNGHATTLYRKPENSPCPNGKCTFYWSGHRANNSSGMICGGITLIMDHIDGYVVLKNSDLIGTRDVVAVKE